MAGIRRGETDHVQLMKNAGREVWFIVFEIVNEVIAQNEYRYARDLLIHLKKASPTTRCFAVWNGNWSTDLFEIDIPAMIKRIELAEVEWTAEDTQIRERQMQNLRKMRKH